MNYVDLETKKIVSARRRGKGQHLAILNEDMPDYDIGLQDIHCEGVELRRNGWYRKWRLQDKPEPVYSEELARRAQSHCKQLLLECDWTIGNDTPLTEENQQEWKAYRTALRAINHQEGFPKSIDWPEPPSAVKEDSNA